MNSGFVDKTITLWSLPLLLKKRLISKWDYKTKLKIKINREMSGKIFNTIALVLLIVTPAFTATLPAFKGSIKVTEFIEKDIEAVLKNVKYCIHALS